jgi:solute carrier family 6 amino acid transporter-like protein 5/7/9/14
MTSIEDEESGVQRPQWSNSMEFMMSCIAMAVGLGNIWRFPFVAFDNGGGAFLVPYLIVLLVIAKPMYYLEVCLGQFRSGGPVHVWALSPALKGKLTAGNVKAECASSNVLFPSYSSVNI